jgi:hypothetical protein
MIHLTGNQRGIAILCCFLLTHTLELSLFFRTIFSLQKSINSPSHYYYSEISIKLPVVPVKPVRLIADARGRILEKQRARTISRGRDSFHWSMMPGRRFIQVLEVGR